MLKKITWLLAIIFALSSCSSYDKAPSGMVYKIKHQTTVKEKKINQNDWLKIHINYVRKRKDSTIISTNDFLPNYLQYDSNVKNPFTLTEVLNKCYVGDKVEMVLEIDSLTKLGFQYNDVFKPHDKVIATAVIIDKFNNIEAKNKDNEKELEQFKNKEIKELRNVLNKKNIKAEEVRDGVFVEISNPGDLNNKVDSGKEISIYYTGKLLANDTVFDSNLKEPRDTSLILKYVQNIQSLIPGWDIGIKKFGKGGKGKMYIPSLLAYGARGGGKIPPFANLVFEIEIVDVKTPLPNPNVANQLNNKVKKSK